MRIENGKYIHFLVDEKLKAQLQKEADEKRLPLNAYIRMILLERKK